MSKTVYIGPSHSLIGICIVALGSVERLLWLVISFQALNAEEARLLHVKEIMQLDERKRPYNSMYESREPTEEEMEAYQMKRQRPDDPMASFLGQ